jgi:hypothetical protein
MTSAVAATGPKKKIVSDLKVPPAVRPAGPAQSAVASNAAAAAPKPAANPNSVVNYVQKDQDVARNVAGVIAKGGPLMQLAQTEGAKTAQRRGLLSSSIAAGAAQNEVLKAATPIGSQNAAQNAQANLSNQGFNETATLSRQKYNFDRGLQDDAQIFEREQRGLDRGLDRETRAADRELQKEIATWNLDASDKERVSNFMTSINSTYESALDAINKNKNLKAGSRADQIKALNARRDNQLKRLQAIYGIKVDLTWDDATTAAQGPITTPTKPKKSGGGGGGIGGAFDLDDPFGNGLIGKLF